ncbi:hypothetical protein NIES4103_60150 [Nostoc sp. NIES-4103]|nr:hypothetical protein NIES4103_60150 [Nostoc sp. NIES-4103]
MYWMTVPKLQIATQLWLQLLLLVGIVVAIAYLAICLFLFIQQPRLIFYPSRVIEKTPELFNLPYEEVYLPVWVKSGKVEYIHGWWIQNNQPDAKVLLYLHGNAINVGANISHANRFYQLGFSVLLIDYRGYGRAQGRFPNEMRVYQDAMIAWNFLVQQQQISPSEIFLYGHSLGGAIAIDLAVKQNQAAGLIVESSFTSIREVIAYRNVFRIFPIDLLLTQRFESIKKVPQFKLPVLFIHGTADSTIPSFMSEKLYAAASEPKTLFLVPDAEHNNTATVGDIKYLRKVKAFVEQAHARRLLTTSE